MPTNEAVFDNSGWNVSIGGGAIDSTAEKTTSQSGATAPGSGFGQLFSQAGLGGIDRTTMVYGAAALLILVMVWKKKS